MEASRNNRQLLFPWNTSPTNPPETIYRWLTRDVFRYPFFDDGVHALHTYRNETKDPESVVSQEVPDLRLSGLIFHTAHCGSTLLAQMLGSSGRVRVVSETEAINGLLLAHVFGHLTIEELIVRLRLIMEAYLPAFPGEEHLLFKLTSWNVFFVDVFQAAFPDVPRIYIDRETTDVVQSLLRSGNGFVQWCDSPTNVLRHYFTGVSDFENKEAFLRKMVELHRSHAIRNENTRFFQYPGFWNEFTRITEHFQLNFAEEERDSAMECLKYDAKSIHKRSYPGAV